MPVIDHLAGVVRVAAVVGALPIVAASADGRWHLAEEDYAHQLAWMPAGREAGDFRVLWIGDPGALPLDGWKLGPGLAYATSRAGTPGVTDLWPGSSSGATRLLAEAVDLARRGQTTEIGHLLGPMAVRYIALPLRAAPDPHGGPISPLPPDLELALRSQLDLKQVESDPAVLVYENVAWVPARASLPVAAAPALADAGAEAARTAELAGSPPVLTRTTGPAAYKGPLDAGSLVYVAESGSSRWQLKVNGHSVVRQPAFGWASSYQLQGAGAGSGSLVFATPFTRYAAILVELVLWALAVREVVRQRRRRRRVEVDISAASTAMDALSVDAVAAAVEAADLGASR